MLGGAAPGLFYAVLAGLGRCAVLVRATLRLVPAPANVRHYILFYPTVDALTADQWLLQADGPLSRSVLRTPLLRVPDEPVIFLFSVLRTAAPDLGGALPVDVLLSHNHALFDQARARRL